MQGSSEGAQNLLKVPVEVRNRNINRIRDSFKLSLAPSKANDIINYVISPRQCPDKMRQQQASTNEGEEEEEEDEEEKKNFNEKYEMLQKLGEGAHGVVKKCRSNLTSKIYAAKVLALDEEQTIFLRRNFRAVRCLNHPNILHYKALHLDQNKNICYLIMEYATGKQLKDCAIKSEQVLKTVFEQVLLATAYMHKMNICHRDIKPDNILFDQNTQQVKIIDFGISKRTVIRNERRCMLTVTGTFNYRAPEFFLGGGYDEGVDVWAAGVTFYELVVGKTPFESEYKMDTIDNILNGEPEFDDEIWGKYSKFLKDLIVRLLRKKCSERLDSAEALHHLWFANDIEKDNEEKYQSMKLSNKTRDFDLNSNFQSVVKKLGLDSIRTVEKPQMSLVESDEDEGLFEDT